MTNRFRPEPSPIHPVPGTPSGGTSHVLSTDEAGGKEGRIRLFQAWQAWESGESSTRLSQALSAPRWPGPVAGTPMWEDWVWFATGASKLDALSTRMLDSRIEWLRTNTSPRIVINGRDIAPGQSELDMGLALRRVLAIWDVLLAHHIDPDRIRITVRGDRWSMADLPGRAIGAGDRAGECRFRVTDPRWLLARN
jgi:outer membrane protein OmpA-like peptidoglycan-associated protein